MGSQQKEVSFQYRSFWKIEKLVRKHRRIRLVHLMVKEVV
jgi:hypothetical protein